MTSTPYIVDPFQVIIDAMIEEQASEHRDLGELCSALPGVYPTYVRERILALQERGNLDGDTSRRLSICDNSQPRQDEVEADSVLPLPHPLDYEWRFSDKTCALLESLAANDESAHIGLFGTPHLAERWSGLARAHLFERRGGVCELLTGVSSCEIACVDLSQDKLAERSLDVVVADPPWYTTITEYFVHAAARMLVPGGRLYLCSPGIGTRPSIAAERCELLNFAQRHGLVLTDILRGILRYYSPPFESSALAAVGLAQFPKRWRSADMFVLQSSGVFGPYEVDTDVADSEMWREIRWGQSCIRVRQRLNEDSEGPVLERIVPNDVLDSVSRRDSRRQSVDVWTTTNGVYRTGSPSELIEALINTTHGEREVSELERSSLDLDEDPIQDPDVAALFILASEARRLQSIGIPVS